MAKWGCGDPRWIVEERSDAKNVNNWHWTEKDASAWSQNKLKELLLDLHFENEIGAFKICDINKCEGEATANNRKSKLIFFYEWNITGNWVGLYKPEKSKVRGTFEILNLSEEHEPEHVDIDIALKNNNEANDNRTNTPSSDACDKMKQIMLKQGSAEIRIRIGQYIKLLKEEFSRDIILPTDVIKPHTSPNTHNISTSTKQLPDSANVNSTSHKLSSKKDHDNLPTTFPHDLLSDVDNLDDVSLQKKVQSGQEVNISICRTKKLTQNETFSTSADDLFSILTDKTKVEAFTQNPIGAWELTKGGDFTILGDNVTGQFVEINPTNHKLVMKWRLAFWPQGHYSLVTIDIDSSEESQGKGVRLKLSQTEIPEIYYEITAQGWFRYYWKPIRDTFGI